MKMKLTGNWYLKKHFFGYNVMVECIATTQCPYTFDESPEFLIWKKAKPQDLFELKIKSY